MSDDGYCCKGECCGPGSWCCQRAGEHTHDDDVSSLSPETEAKLNAIPLHLLERYAIERAKRRAQSDTGPAPVARVTVRPPE